MFFQDVLKWVRAMRRSLGGLGVFACFLRRLEMGACHAKASLGGLGSLLCTKASWSVFSRCLEMGACHAKESWRSWRLCVLFKTS